MLNKQVMKYVESVIKSLLYTLFRFETEHDRQGRIARMQCELDIQHARAVTR